MDKIQSMVLKLTRDDLIQLRFYLWKQNKKVQSLNLLLKQPTNRIKYEEIAFWLRYYIRSKAFYTLKHRFNKDILDFKVLTIKNEIYSIEDLIKNLRLLLYSKETDILQDEINYLKLECERLEIYRGLYEINLCDFLINYSNIKKKVFILRKMSKNMKLKMLLIKQSSSFTE